VINHTAKSWKVEDTKYMHCSKKYTGSNMHWDSSDLCEYY